MMRFFLLFVCCFLVQNLFAQILIRNTNVVDVESKKMLKNQDVVVVDDKIVAVGNNIKYKLPGTTTVIDGTGKYLIPGLIDAHVHFFQSGGMYARPDAINLTKYQPYDKEIQWVHRHMEDFLKGYTKAGITTVVDVGSTINFLKQRDTFQNKPYAPAVYMTGPLLTTWEPPAFKGLQDDGPFYEMKTEQDARQYVQKQLPAKPDFIKIWYILLDRDKEAGARKNLPLVQAVIDEAHKNNLRVAVHATERITAQLAVEAGADFLVHGIDDEPVDAAFVQLLKKKAVVLCPTLVVSGNYRKAFAQKFPLNKWDMQYAHATPLASVIDFPHLDDTALTSRYRNYANGAVSRQKTEDSILRTNLKKLLDGGVTIATGTDAGNIGTQHVSSYFDELEAMQQTGFSFWQLLESSTINGAKAVGKQALVGSIKKDKVADMVLLNANPLESIQNWTKIEAVINKGKIVNRDSLQNFSPADLAQQQLNAYNAHDLDAFLLPYADDVEVYDFPSKQMMKGKEEMRKAYQFVTKTPKLYCRLLNRIVQGNMVIDHEEVYGFGEKPLYGVAMYVVEKGKIKKVYFHQ